MALHFYLKSLTCRSSVKDCSWLSDWLLVSATQLKPDEGTPELPEGRVRVRLESDGSLHDVTKFEIEKVAPFLQPLDVSAFVIKSSVD